VHPGYGFLAENADFARACRDAGLIFIGPSAESIEKMGDKAAARALASTAGVPVVPGSAGGVSPEEAVGVAQEIGYPLMIKAAAGGGGRGIRIAQDEAELKRAVQVARQEAEATTMATLSTSTSGSAPCSATGRRYWRRPRRRA
jgi:acetyl-CoA carboxylase biotin carboxylase subunit